MNLLGLSGSLRAQSDNTKLLHEAFRLAGASFALGDLRLPLYDGDLESSGGIPQEVNRLAEQIAQADAVVISTPEYNKGLSGVLKNALDWVSRVEANPWLHKPVAVMSAAAGRTGGEQAQAMLRNCLVPFRPRIVAGPALHIAGSFGEFDENGRLKNERYLAALAELMEQLAAMSDRASD